MSTIFPSLICLLLYVFLLTPVASEIQAAVSKPLLQPRMDKALSFVPRLNSQINNSERILTSASRLFL